MGFQDWSDSGEPRGAIPDELLARYAAGSLDPDLHRAVAQHLVRCPADRAFTESLERMAGHLLSESEPVAPANATAMLAAILADHPRRKRRHKSSSHSAAGMSRF